uniref:Transposon protein, putative, mutator sub-class n=2 Tax=Oryza sativa subsp. japonica TaxID=39947 RepID=Q2R6P2_ORYSJ|nr:transposon protein, putative, mutator sub-class [Oryza sativa Japonica Group]ABA92848.1 transposon protein, putative, Mutator sub-class [Oryza sativa Japonica Group]
MRKLGPDLPIGFENSRFDGKLTHTIWLLINLIRTLQSQHHVPSGYQPCRNQVDLTEKANPCMRIELHKQEQGLPDGIDRIDLILSASAAATPSRLLIGSSFGAGARARYSPTCSFPPSHPTLLAPPPPFASVARQSAPPHQVRLWCRWPPLLAHLLLPQSSRAAASIRVCRPAVSAAPPVDQWLCHLRRIQVHFRLLLLSGGDAAATAARRRRQTHEEGGGSVKKAARSGGGAAGNTRITGGGSCGWGTIFKRIIRPFLNFYINIRRPTKNASERHLAKHSPLLWEGLIAINLACNFMVQKIWPLKDRAHPAWEYQFCGNDPTQESLIPINKYRATNRIYDFFKPGTVIITNNCPNTLHYKVQRPPAAWFNESQTEMNKLKGFNGAADKADSEACYEACLSLLQKIQKIIERSKMKSEALKLVFGRVRKICQV